jgi:hypothetical protein
MGHYQFLLNVIVVENIVSRGVDMALFLFTQLYGLYPVIKVFKDKESKKLPKCYLRQLIFVMP